MTILFQRIKQVCAENKISLYRVEKDAKLTPSSLIKWSESMPSGDKIMRVANVLDVSVDYLLGNTDNPQSHKTEIAQIPFASELSNAVANLETSAKQTEAHIHRVKSILQANGIDAPSQKSNDK